MTALYALVHLIIGPSSESRCLCTYKVFMDAHAQDASGQSRKLMCRHSKAGCIDACAPTKQSWMPMHMMQVGSPGSSCVGTTRQGAQMSVRLQSNPECPCT